MKRSDKFRQANREAKATLWATLAVIVFWTISGFGLAHSSISFLHTPLWVWGGCVGTWLFAILVACYLAYGVFQDIPLDDEEAQQHED